MAYHTVQYGKKAQRRNYSKMRYDIDLPNLIEIQTASFEWFANEGLKELFDDLSPIESYNGEYKLYFSNHYFKPPKYSVMESKKRDVSYAKPLFVTVRLEKIKTGEVVEKQLFMGDLQFMTPTGTFIVNGAERVIVSQIIRSSGVYFTSEFDKKTNRMHYLAQVIPTRGSWLEYEMGAKNIIYGKLDRSKKVTLTTLIQVLGFSGPSEILRLFPSSKTLLMETMLKDEKDGVLSTNTAVEELYSKMRQGEKIPVEAAKDFIRSRLFDPRRYDLEKVGRFKYKQKLDVIHRLRQIAQGIPYTIRPDVYTYADNIVNPQTKEVIIKKGDVVNLDSIKVLEDNKDAIRVQVLAKELSLQNETETAIFGIKTSDLHEQYAHETIYYLPTESKQAAILVEKGAKITASIREQINYLKERIIFLEENESGEHFVSDPNKTAILVALYGKSNEKPLKYKKNIKIEEDIINHLTGEIIVTKGTTLTPEIRHTLLQERNGLSHESLRYLTTFITNDIVLINGDTLFKEGTIVDDEVFFTIYENKDSLSNYGDLKYTAIYAKADIEILKDLKKDQEGIKPLIYLGHEITEDNLLELQMVRNKLDENVIKYFLVSGKKDAFYLKEAYRRNVFVERVAVKVTNEKGVNETIEILGHDSNEKRLYISVSDIIATISYYLNLYDGVGIVDDIDHLSNRRLRLIGELIKNQFRIGLAKLEKNIKDRMSTADVHEATPQSLINIKPLTASLKEFFGSSQLSQFMDQINPLAELTQKRRISALGVGGLARDRAGVEVRDVHESHYGRICPIETPEGPSIGLISSLSTYAKVDEYGFIQTPYLKIKENENKEKYVSDELVYLTALDEQNYIIASANTPLDEEGRFTEEMVVGRLMGATNVFPKNEIAFIDVSPKQLVSVATATIPFLEHDDASRALMGANMQRQAVPLLIPESPIVGTGVEHRALKDSGTAVVNEEDGLVLYVDAKRIDVLVKPKENIVTTRGKVIYDLKDDFTIEAYEKLRAAKQMEKVRKISYPLSQFLRSNQDTAILHKPLVKIGDLVNKGEIIADGPSAEKGELALGRNVMVAFMTWEGYNYEDAIIMSERLVKDDVYTSVHIDEHQIESRDTKLGKEEITREVPNAPTEQLKYLDERGIIIPGTEVREGDILVGKITPKGLTDPTPEEKLLQAIFNEKAREVRDTSLKVPHGGGGIVHSVQHFSKANGDDLKPGINESVRVYIVKKRKISEGDKMAGRHGNKGVISKILPVEDMPYMEDGTPIDIMLNPLGVPSRMNIGQVLEVHLGMAANSLGIKIATPVFDGVNSADLKAIMKEAKMSEDGKYALYDGRTGEKFENKINVGIMYLIKLSHMVDDKLHSRSVGPYTLVTQQPMGGKAQNGGQRFGEMEVWALYAYGASHTLKELLTVKSDDIIGRNRVYKAITDGKEIPDSHIPESFRVLIRELQSLGLYVELIDAETGENEVNKSLVDESSSFTRRRYW
ncbi:MAG: DNA-directed RNA polymerase subunit beta [Acholeplasmataceae bacterium]|nr:DNA-directed RNA polymerase subunit beta [Acholeplasmataceae bacterium]